MTTIAWLKNIEVTSLLRLVKQSFVFEAPDCHNKIDETML